MARVEEEGSNLESQRKETEQLLKKPLASNDIWYVVDFKWFKSFKKYIGMDSAWDVTGLTEEHPGPVDNSSLFIDADTCDIREHLIEELDYVLVPEELWNLLVKWYGIIDGQIPIARKIVEFGLFVKNYKVEVYLLEVKLCKDFDLDKHYMHKFSKSDTIAHIANISRKLYNISESTDVRLWGSFSSNTYDELKIKSTIQDEGLFMHQVIVVETCNPDGTWLRQTKNTTNMGEIVHQPMKTLIFANSYDVASGSTIVKNEITSTERKISRMNDDDCSTIASSNSILDKVERNTAGSSMMRSTRFNSAYGGCSSDMGQLFTPGICGLCNLGNTCFMNSVIQCMSNCPPVTKHFVDEEYIKDLNTVNPLGMRGEIATAFGELIKVMWSGKYSFTVPHHFKIQVGKFAPQFSGYQQHDSQELLTFLLDGLHEDLNRIKKKPYIELSDSDGRSDEELAAEAWENYQKRNDSIIVDNFHGLLKSTVVCPDCAKISVTFDPFCYLSLPLPIKRERHIEITFFPFDSTKTPQAYRVMVPKRGHIHDLLVGLSQMCGLSPDEMVVTEITKHHFHKFFSVNDPLETIEPKDDIAVYEIPNMDSHVPVPVCLWEVNIKQAFNFSQLFGHPMILMLPRENCTYEVLYSAILEKLFRYIVVPNENNSTWRNQKSGHDDNNNASGSASNSKLSLQKVPHELFTLHVVNASTTSVVNRLHNDGNIIYLPISETIGRQYLAAQWTSENRTQYFNEQIVNDMDRHDNLRQRRSQKVLLSDCLELYTLREKLGADDAWYCPSCKKHQRATKKFDLWNLPTILIIHLKRFSYSRYRRDKIDTHVEFPIKDLDMSNYIINPNHPPARYNLIGVCNHFGGMGGGHYTAFALNKINQNWYSFDDNSVSPIQTEVVVSNSAYVLFYMRSD